MSKVALHESALRLPLQINYECRSFTKLYSKYLILQFVTIHLNAMVAWLSATI